MEREDCFMTRKALCKRYKIGVKTVSGFKALTKNAIDPSIPAGMKISNAG